MNYYMIEGTLLDTSLMNDDIMKEHQGYTQQAMDRGDFLISALKHDNSGALFIMKAEEERDILNYLAQEPFSTHGIQEYRVIQFDMHYHAASIAEWFH